MPDFGAPKMPVSTGLAGSWVGPALSRRVYRLPDRSGPRGGSFLKRNQSMPDRHVPSVRWSSLSSLKHNSPAIESVRLIPDGVTPCRPFNGRR